jgi:hypothetical protein
LSWKEVGYQGLGRDACPPQWAGIIKNLEGRTQEVAFKYVEDGVIVSEITEALHLYAEETAHWYEEDLTLPVDAYRQPEAPWSQGVMRREAARGFNGFLWNNELAERHPRNARTPAQGIHGIQGDSEAGWRVCVYWRFRG